MECQSVLDILEEQRRSPLPPDVVQALEAHLAACQRCLVQRDQDDALAALIRRTLPRPAAPSALRLRILAEAPRPSVAGTPPPRGVVRRWLWHPAVTAALAAVLVAAGLAPWAWRAAEPPPDPVETLLRSGVSEHARILLQLPTLPSGIADPAASFAQVRSLTSVALAPAFAGNDELRLATVRPTVLANRKAAAVVFRDRRDIVTTCFALPGTDLPMPASHRVQIDQYKPHIREVDGRQVIYWKQGDLAYLMVSERDPAGSRDLFLRVRRGL